MSEMAGLFAAQRQHSQLKRAHNRQSSADLLRSRGVDFSVRNDGAHLIIHAGPVTFDFWPGTGRWSDRNGGRGFGVRSLLERIERDSKRPTE